jgi:ribosomal protein S2
MKDLPKAVFVIDPKKEVTAVKEAQDMGIPVIAL